VVCPHVLAAFSKFSQTWTFANEIAHLKANSLVAILVEEPLNQTQVKNKKKVFLKKL